MKTHQIKLFWEWFYGNEITLRKLREEQPQIQKAFIYWLDRHLHNYCDGLDCIILCPEQSSDRVQLIITANGNPAYFSHVSTLAAHAPELKHWKIIAFLQPCQDLEKIEAGLDKPYVFKDVILKASELKFRALDYGSDHKINMIVYLKDFTAHCTNKNLLQVVFTIMQDLLGEKILYRDINFVELAQLPENHSAELLHLYELQHYLDALDREGSAAKE